MTRRDVPPMLTIFVVVVVTGAWAGALLASLVTQEYQPVLYASGPMLAIVGYVTGIKVARNGRGD